MEVLRSLVALTDPQEGKLAQSQEKVSDPRSVYCIV